VASAAVVFHREANTNKTLPNAMPQEDSCLYRHPQDHHRHWAPRTQPRVARNSTA